MLCSLLSGTIGSLDSVLDTRYLYTLTWTRFLLAGLRLGPQIDRVGSPGQERVCAIVTAILCLSAIILFTTAEIVLTKYLVCYFFLTATFCCTMQIVLWRSWLSLCFSQCSQCSRWYDYMYFVSIFLFETFIFSYLIIWCSLSIHVCTYCFTLVVKLDNSLTFHSAEF